RGNPGPAGYGAVVRDAASGRVLAERAAGIGRATNNVAEYGGLIAGLRAAQELGATEVDVRMDSKLVVEQMSGRWKVKHPAMQPLAREAAGLVRGFERVRFSWIPRAENAHADRLANAAMDAAARGQAWQPDAADEWLAQHDPVPVEPEPAASLHDAVPNRLSGWQEDPSPPTTTLLLRHGQTAMSVDKRFSGVGDPVLTEAGQAMAAAAAVRLAGSGAVAVVSSPLRRARQTAAAVAAALGVDVEVEDGLRETDFGDWEGYTFAEVRQKWPAELDAWLASTAVAPPHGESFDATTTRVRAALRRLLARHGGSTVVVVSHVTPIKTLLRLALEAPPTSLYRMHLDLVSLSEVQWFADGPAVVRSMNDTGHLSA
ncbi:MAG: bifunctional RNase H/acid phosphatase, partial [Actinomycetes bacterium]